MQPENKPAGVFAGDTWEVFRPGTDATFKDNWVTRTFVGKFSGRKGNLCSCVNSAKALVENAILCQVLLTWNCLILCLALLCSGCVATKTITIDPAADWVKIGPDVTGTYYLRVGGQWVLQKSKLHYPHGWVAGPEPK